MRYKIILFLFLVLSAIGKENYLNIDARSFEANEQKHFIHFKGEVKMEKGSDSLRCDELIIKTKMVNKKQIPTEYKAIGSVKFTIKLTDNTISGKGDNLFYYPEKKQYIIMGNAYLEDTKDDKKLSANKIYIDEKTGQTKIDGTDDKPVKFRLKLGQ